MINKCKVQIGIIELYNVIESHNEGDGKTVFSTQEIELFVEYPFWCFFIPATTLSIPEADQIH